MSAMQNSRDNHTKLVEEIGNLQERINHVDDEEIRSKLEQQWSQAMNLLGMAGCHLSIMDSIFTDWMAEQRGKRNSN